MRVLVVGATGQLGTAVAELGIRPTTVAEFLSAKVAPAAPPRLSDVMGS